MSIVRVVIRSNLTGATRTIEVALRHGECVCDMKRRVRREYPGHQVVKVKAGH